MRGMTQGNGKRGIRLGLGVLAALGLLIGGRGASAQITSSSPGCFPPEIAAEFIYDLISLGYFGDLPSDRGLCRDYCERAFRTCKHVVRNNYTCFLHLIRDANALQRLDCADLSDPEDRASCNQSIQEDTRDFHFFNDESKEFGFDVCFELRDDCLSECLAPL